MCSVYLIGESIISALGTSMDQNMQHITALEGGIWTDSPSTNGNPIPQHLQSAPSLNQLALGFINWQAVEKEFITNTIPDTYTRFEKLLLLAINKAIVNTGIDTGSSKTLFILSTTKGNIELLNEELAKQYPNERIQLWSSAQEISRFYGNNNTAIVISNACVSGVMATTEAANILRNSNYNHAIVIGGDIITNFVLSGFLSFQSLSDKACKPYDSERNGLNLGEAAGCLILSKDIESDIEILEGASHNDANHISGPSRTAEGMYYAVNDALKYSKIGANDIDIVSTHGTATAYNDEMEAIGLSRLGMQKTPIHSLKGYWGHTLGAAGIIEIAALSWAMKHNTLLPTLGYKNHGVSKELNIQQEAETKEISYALKVASGFSGINSALILKKKGGKK